MNLLRQVCMKLQQIFSNKFLMINIVVVMQDDDIIYGFMFMLVYFVFLSAP